MLTFPGICSNDLSADCALHRAVNTSTAAPVDTLQLEFVVDAAEPETHCLSLALNPMRWAFFWAACKRFNPGVATDVRWLRLRLFYVSSCPFCATRRRKTWRGSNLHYFRNESSRDVRTGKEKRKLVGVELSVWGDERAAFSTSTRSIEWTSW